MVAKRDNRDLLHVLEMEDLFLKIGGYDKPPVSRPGGPSLIFQDSPACPNVNKANERVPCKNCALTPLVPTDQKTATFPCRHIPLNDIGETVDTLYQWGTLAETKLILADWLKRTIGELRFIRQAHPPKAAGKGYYRPDCT